MNFPTPEHSYSRAADSREPYSTLAVAQRPHAFSSDWRGIDTPELSRPRAPNVPESLPSLRTMFPAFESQERPIDSQYREDRLSLSPTAQRSVNTSPGSNKRRRLSNDFDDDEVKQHQSVGRSRSPVMSRSYYGSNSATTSPNSSTARRDSLRSAPDSRTYPNQGSPYMPRAGREQPIPSIPERRAPYQDHYTSRPSAHNSVPEPSKWPNLPSLIGDRYNDRSYSQTSAGRSYGDYPPRNDYPRGEYALDAARPYHQQNYATSHDSYAASQSEYGYQQPRNQPYSGSPYGQTPFTSGNHPGNYSPGHYQTQDMGDNRPRKRRGNLPKPTTDILTAWFIQHLEHPYPNEEEKQQLMRQTSLQLNQISNWFINARRRKLPQLQNSARAENAARSHHNRMHSADEEQSPMSICNSDAPLSPSRLVGGFAEGWPAIDEEASRLRRY